MVKSFSIGGKEGKLPHPNQHHQSLNPPNRNIFQDCMNVQSVYVEGKEHCRKKWILTHNKIVVKMSCDHRQSIQYFYPPAKTRKRLRI